MALIFIVTCSVALPGDESGATAISWTDDLPDALRKCRRGGVPLLAAFSAAWCEEGERLHAETLQDPAIVALAGRFLWVRVDVERNVGMVREYGITNIPFLLLFDRRGELRTRISGVPGPYRLRRMLEELFEDSPQEAPPETLAAEPQGPEMPDGFRERGTCLLNVGYGPLSISSQSPFQSLRFGLLPRTPSTLGKGDYEFRWTETWVNLWAENTDDWIIDAEMLQSELTLAYGATDTLQVELGLSQKSRFGGSMDGFIHAFHDAFGIDQDGRDPDRSGEFRVQFVSPEEGETRTLSNGDRGSFSESLRLTVQHNLAPGTRTWPALSWSVTVRGDLGDPDNFTHEEPVDVALSISAAKQVGDFHLYLSSGIAWFGSEEFLGFKLRTTQASALAALEWRFSAYGSVVLQYLISEGVAEELERFRDPSREVTLGIKAEILHNAVLEFGVIENGASSENSLDVGFHAGLAVRF